VTELEQAVQDVRAASPLAPRLALVLGSGLGSFADSFEARVALPYASIRGMPRPSVEGHAGNLVLGTLHGVPVVTMQGRTHLYEGHPPSQVVFGVRLMLKLGARTLLVTNAAGGIDPSFAAGTLMLIEDHLNLTGQSCLVGPNDPALGVRFPDMSHAYDPGLRQRALALAARLGIPLHTGVYAGLLGPSYETPAEVRMLGRLGASAVGMSTVQEVLAARHMGARCLGISCVTNPAAGLSKTPLDHDEVQAIAKAASGQLSALLGALIGELGRDG
jgi:purine-nucleoside phosphorylase